MDKAADPTLKELADADAASCVATVRLSWRDLCHLIESPAGEQLHECVWRTVDNGYTGSQPCFLILRIEPPTAEDDRVMDISNTIFPSSVDYQSERVAAAVALRHDQQR